MNSSAGDLLLAFLDKDSQKTIDINVVGDVMFDEYHEVEVERISPEFPIPVYKSNSLDPCSEHNSRWSGKRRLPIHNISMFNQNL